MNVAASMITRRREKTTESAMFRAAWEWLKSDVGESDGEALRPAGEELRKGDEDANVGRLDKDDEEDCSSKDGEELEDAFVVLCTRAVTLSSDLRQDELSVSSVREKEGEHSRINYIIQQG